MLKRSKPAGGVVKVTFALRLDEPAGLVSVLGDFNDWDHEAHPLRKRSNGMRSAVVELPVGTTFHFKYLADDGTWFNEDEADWYEANEYGEVNSVVSV